MAVEAARLTARIDADSKEGEAGLKRFHGLLGDVAGGFSNIISTAGGFALGSSVLGGIGMVTGFLKDAVKEGEGANAAIAQTTAVLKSTGGAAGVTSQQVDQLATKYMNLTGIQDDTVRGAENMLLTFTNIHSNVFPQATKTVLDMSTALGQDTKSSAIQLGKALNDPIHGITALQRVGVTFTDQQKEQIKQMMAAGNTAGAQGVILQELNKEFGGSAEAAGKANGGIKILGAQFDNMKQSLGQALIPILGQVMTALSPVIGALGNALPGILKQVTGFLSGMVGPALAQLGQTVSGFLPQLEQLGKTFLSDVLPAIQQVWQIVQNDLIPMWQQEWNIIQTDVIPIFEQLVGIFVSDVLPAMASLQQWSEQHLMPAIKRLADFVKTTVVPIVHTMAQVFKDDVVPAAERIGTVITDKLIPPLQNIAQKILPILNPIIQGLGGILGNVVGPAIEFVINGVAALATFVSDLINTLGNFMGTIGKVIDSIGNVLGWLGSLADKLTGGVTDAVNGIGSTFSSVFQGIMGAVKDPLNWVIGAINTLIDGLDSIKVSIPGWVPGVGGKKFGIDIPEIPKLASGGNVSGLFYGAEQGMELLVSPGMYNAPAGSHVFNAGDTKELLKGMSRPNYTVNVYPAKSNFTERDMDAVLRRYAFLSNTGAGY